MTSLARLLRAIPHERARAVERGELASVWPGAAWDMVSLVLWRGVVWPVVDVLRAPHPDDDYHSPTGGCPICNPPTTDEPR